MEISKQIAVVAAAVVVVVVAAAVVVVATSALHTSYCCHANHCTT